MSIRLLKPNEIDVRVLTINEKGFSVLLYKDARVDMAILDEVFGMYGWKRKHEVINGNLFCTVSIYDKETQQWIDKQDVGVESYTEKQKGEASDSFKRACFNVGIGRELYTAPSFMWIAAAGDVKEVKGKYTTYTKLKVTEIGYNALGEINQLTISDDKGRERYKLGKPNTHPEIEDKTPTQTVTTKKPTLQTETQSDLICNDCKIEIADAVKTYSIKNYGKALCRSCQNKNEKI